MFIPTLDKNPQIASSFWAGNSITHRRDDGNVYVLTSHKRAISNFVRIVTGKSHPVKFVTNNESYTDGKTVTIGANIVNPVDFDIAVGLALHEASHIALSNFKLLKELEINITSIIGSGEFNKLLDRSTKRGIRMASAIKDLCNWVEDRRIDEWVYDRAPGYRPYYHSMYNKYFWSDAITKGLKSGSARDETYESYMFRIINLHNSATDLDALKKLREISEIVDLDNINRLKSTKKALAVAIDIYKRIIDALDEADEEQKEADENDESNQSESNDSSDSDSKAGGSSAESDNESSGDSADGDNEADVDETPKELSEDGKQNLEDAIERQRDFLKGEVNKKIVSDDIARNVSVVEASGSEMKDVGGTDNSQIGKTKCIVAKKLDQSYIDSNMFPLKAPIADIGSYEEVIRKGIRFGKRMVGKLQTRSEERNTMYNRQRRGKIDKRMLNSLGYGNNSVFYVNEVDKFENANLHISVDASGSMRGMAWDNAMIMAVALATAIEEIPNLEVQISFRGTIYGATQDLPYVVIAYDSRVDKFVKIRKLFPQLGPSGTTPEGLCFEAIMDEMVKSSSGMKSYFLNLSDGMPCFQNTDVNYDNHNAPAHIRSLVNKMKEMGINVLSYFISDRDRAENSTTGKVFKESYDSSASFIDTQNVTQIVKTMNNLFMTKE